MTEPDTWMGTETGRWPHNAIHTERGGSTSTTVDQSVNKPLPWLVLCAILSGAAITFAAMTFFLHLSEMDRLKTEVRLLDDSVQQLIRESK